MWNTDASDSPEGMMIHAVGGLSQLNIVKRILHTQAHNQLNPENLSLRSLPKMILDCVKLTIQANHHT